MKILPTLHLTNLLAKPLIPSQVHRAWPIILLLGLGGPVLTTAEEVPLLEDPISNPNDATFADDLNFADDEISADLPHLSGHLVHEEDVDIFSDDPGVPDAPAAHATTIYYKIDHDAHNQLRKAFKSPAATCDLVNNYIASCTKVLPAYGIKFRAHYQGSESYIDILAGSPQTPLVEKLLGQGFKVQIYPIKNWRQNNGFGVNFADFTFYVDLGHLINPRSADFPVVAYWSKIFAILRSHQPSFMTGSITEVSRENESNLRFLGQRKLNPHGLGIRRLNLPFLLGDIAQIKNGIANWAQTLAHQDQHTAPYLATVEFMLRQKFYTALGHLAATQYALNMLMENSGEHEVLAVFHDKDSAYNRSGHLTMIKVPEYLYYLKTKNHAYYFQWPLHNYQPNWPRWKVSHQVLREIGQSAYFTTTSVLLLWPLLKSFAHPLNWTADDFARVQKAIADVEQLIGPIEKSFPRPFHRTDFNRPFIKNILPNLRDKAAQVMHEIYQAKQTMMCEAYLTLPRFITKNKMKKTKD